MSKLIVVVGSTGNQGSSVVKTFLDEPGWTVRALTRHPDSPSAQRLKENGVHQVVAADLDNAASLFKAFEGAYAIFSVTDFWTPYYDPSNNEKAVASGKPKNVWIGEREEQQGKNVFAAAAQTAGLQRLIFSSLSNVTKWSHGRYSHVYHFDSKAHAAEYGQATYPDLWKKTSIIQVGYYLSNLVAYPFLKPQKDEDGVYVFSYCPPPEVKLPLIAADEDTGPLTKALLEVPPGKNLIAYRAWMTMAEYVESISRVKGVKAITKSLPPDAPMDMIPEELREELIENMLYFHEFGYEGRDDPSVVHPKDLGVQIQLPSVEDWIQKQDMSSVFE